jgi:predicted transcriptional regulator YheO
MSRSLPPEIKKQRAATRSRAWYKNNLDKAKSTKLMKSYSITIEQYKDFDNAFGNVCHICEGKCPSGRKLAVDHDHKSGLIRGLLCINCNKGLGNFKDNIELISKAIEYLKTSEEIKNEVENAVNAFGIEESLQT